MKLYSGPLSLFTAKVRIALAEKTIDHQLVDVPFSRARGYAPKHPDVARINPKGQVPVLVDGDLELYESTVILEYLEDVHPEPPLVPRDPRDRARCRLLEIEADEVFFPNVLVLIREVFYKPDPAARDEETILRARDGLLAGYERLDARLEGREHLIGTFTVADLSWFLSVTFATLLGVPPPAGLTNVSRWLTTVGARPSIAAETAAMSAFASSLTA